MKVIIPAAGKGTRMLPLTDKKAKALLPVAGKPVINHVIDSLNGIGVSEYIFIIGHLGEQIRNHVEKEYVKKGRMKARFIEQKVLDGTAGSIRAAQEFIDEPVLIILGDNVLTADFSVITDCQDAGIIWGNQVEDPRHLGVIVSNNGYLERIVEKPKEIISNLASTGTMFIRDHKGLFNAIEHLYSDDLSHDGEYYLPDALQYMIDHGAKIRVAQVTEWYDCGKPETTLESNRALIDGTIQSDVADANVIEPVCIGKRCTLSNCTIGPDVSIGDDTTVDGATVSDSIIDKDCTIKNVTIKRSIIGEGAVIEEDKEDEVVI